MTIALPVRRFEELAQRRVRVALPHAMKVEPRFNGLAPLDLPRRLPVSASPRAGRGLDTGLGAGLEGGGAFFRRRLGARLGRLDRGGAGLFRSASHCGPPAPTFGVALEFGVALAHGAKHSAKRLNGWEARLNTAAALVVPAMAPAASPVPKKISPRWGPLIAEPTSWAIISRRNGAPSTARSGAATKIGVPSA